MFTKLRNFLREPVSLIGLIMLALSLFVGLFGYLRLHSTFDLLTFIEDFYANISAELGSIAITVIVIDQLQRRREHHRQIEELKRRLIREVGSSDNGTALNAVRELRERGWLEGEKGVLQKASLKSANLSGADLSHANLQGSSLQNTILKATLLSEANLKEAKLSNADLEKADLSNANLQGANFWNACLKSGSLYQANLQGAYLT